MLLLLYRHLYTKKVGVKNYIANSEKYTIIKSTFFYICNVFNSNSYRINAIAINFFLQLRTTIYQNQSRYYMYNNRYGVTRFYCCYT